MEGHRKEEKYDRAKKFEEGRRKVEKKTVQGKK